jgi:phosphotransferase system HPr (HPr) family protein
MNKETEYSTVLVPENQMGWHMRPVALLVGVAKMFESEIIVKCGQKIANAKSVMGILMLGADQDAKLHVSARGRDAQLAISAIEGKFASNPSLLKDTV